MTQYVINIGTLPNDGTGDPLRTAFNETNLNFDQVFTAGPVLSNIQIANNTILTTNTNGNLVLAPNGIGVVQANVHLVPNTANIRNLGAADRRWSTVYVQYANVSGGLSVANLTATGDVTVGGNLSVTGNIINVANIITDAKTIQLANTAGTANAADGSGITVGANDAIATMLYSSADNAWTFNIGVSTPNIVVNNISSDDSTFVTVQDGLDVQGDITAETISLTGNVTADYFLGNGSQLTGVSNYANANAVAYGEAGWAGNIVPAANVTYSLGNSTLWWSNVWVAGNTIYIGGVPIGMAAGNVLTVNGNAVLQNDSNTSISTTGNITAAEFFGNIAGDKVIGNVANAVYAESAGTAVSVPAGNITGLANVATTGNYSDLSGTPTNVSSFTNDAGYITTATANVISVNGQTGVVSLTIPTATSNLINDSGFITTANIPTNVSAFTNDAGYITANVTGSISATGNITGNYFIGNGSQLTGLPASYTDSNVTTLLSNLGSNSISTTGNITADNFFGNISFSNLVGNQGFSQSSSPSSYTVNQTDGSIFAVVPANTVNTSSSVTLIGQNYQNYGDFINENFLHLLENFSSNTAPTSPLTGQLWWDNSGNVLKVYDSASWQSVGSTYSDANVANFLAAFGSNSISTTGNVTANNISGNILVTGNVTGTTANVTLIAGSYSWVFDNTGNTAFANGTVTAGNLSATGASIGERLVSTLSVGNEGGQVNLSLPAANTTLTTGITLDSFQDRFRVFETGGTNRGMFIDLDTSPAGGAAIGYRDLPQVSLSANVTADATDAGKHFYSTTAGNIVLTIPDNANVAFPTGATLTIVVNAAGNVLVNQGTGVSLYQAGASATGNRVVGAYGLATVMKVATDTWVISGTGVY